MLLLTFVFIMLLSMTFICSFLLYFPAKRDLNIVEYSFSQTTLEQVFLKFSHDNGDEDD